MQIETLYEEKNDLLQQRTLLDGALQDDKARSPREEGQEEGEEGGGGIVERQGVEEGQGVGGVSAAIVTDRARISWLEEMLREKVRHDHLLDPSPCSPLLPSLPRSSYDNPQPYFTSILPN